MTFDADDMEGCEWEVQYINNTNYNDVVITYYFKYGPYDNLVNDSVTIKFSGRKFLITDRLDKFHSPTPLADGDDSIRVVFDNERVLCFHRGELSGMCDKKSYVFEAITEHRLRYTYIFPNELFF